MAIVTEVTENECIIERHLRNIDPVRHSLWQPIGRHQCCYMPDIAEGYHTTEQYEMRAFSAIAELLIIFGTNQPLTDYTAVSRSFEILF